MASGMSFTTGLSDCAEANDLSSWLACKPDRASFVHTHVQHLPEQVQFGLAAIRSWQMPLVVGM